MHRRLYIGSVSLSLVSALWTTVGAQDAAPGQSAAQDATTPQAPSSSPQPSFVLPGSTHPTHALIGSRVRLEYAPFDSGSKLGRSSIIEGTLADTDADRFTIVRNERDTSIVLRREATSIMVRKRISRWPAALGAGLFGLLIGQVLVNQNEDVFGGELQADAWPWVTGVAAAGVTAALLSPDRHWVPAAFPP